MNGFLSIGRFPGQAIKVGRMWLELVTDRTFRIEGGNFKVGTPVKVGGSVLIHSRPNPLGGVIFSIKAPRQVRIVREELINGNV